MAKVKAETLLRKIQKGSPSVASKAGGNSGFTFNTDGGIQIFKRREIVEPYLHPIDSRMINDNIEKEIKNNLKNIDPNIEKNYEQLMPRHLVNDLYSLYFNRAKNTKFSELGPTNKVKFEILEQINNSLIKIVTNESHLGSFVYSQEITKFLYKKFMALPPEQQEQLKKALDNTNQGDQQGDGQKKGQGQGGGKGKPNPNQKPGQNQAKGKPGGPGGDEEAEGEIDEDQDSSNSNDSQGDETRQERGPERGGANNSNGNNSEKDMSQQQADKLADDLEKMLGSKQAQKELDQAMKEAEKKLDKLKDIGVDIEHSSELPEEEQKEIVKNLNNLDRIKSSLSQLAVSKEKTLAAVKKILSSTSNYYSKKAITTEVELFEADEFLEINGLEYLHPIFAKSKLFDLTVTEKKFIGKFDLYVDCSGSMGAGCGGKMLGNVPRIDLAKALAMQMKQMGILGNLYEFEDRPKKILNTEMSILMMDARGGTNIESVLQNILKSGNNSVVLTDGESHITSYTEKALFIGVGTDFHYFRNYEGPGKQLIENEQCIMYDGDNFVTAGMNAKLDRSIKASW